MTQCSLKKDCFVFEGIVVVEINGPINIRVFKSMYLTTSNRFHRHEHPHSLPQTPHEKVALL